MSRGRRVRRPAWPLASWNLYGWGGDGVNEGMSQDGRRVVEQELGTAGRAVAEDFDRRPQRVVRAGGRGVGGREPRQARLLVGAGGGQVAGVDAAVAVE